MINYGDYVEVKGSAPSKFFPGERGWVVGIVEQNDIHPLKKWFTQTRIILVEKEDGSDFEVPEIYLRLVEKYSEDNTK